MLIACWSPKGGTGTTVVSCGLALVLAHSQATHSQGSPFFGSPVDPPHATRSGAYRPGGFRSGQSRSGQSRSGPFRSGPSSSASSGVLIADLSGDVPAVLGVPTPASPGLVDWLAAGPDVPADALGRLETDAAPGLRLLAWGGELTAGAARSQAGGERGEVLAEALAAGGRVVVADCGSAASGAALAVAAAADVSLLVLRPCYLALRRALAAPIRPSAVVLVNEPGRALTRRDIEEVLGVPVRAEIDFDPSIARAVDAGLLAGRVPRALERALREAA